MEERFLLFRAAGQGFACDLREVSEVMEPQQYSPIPAAPPHFLGLFNFHGVLTALVDLALYLGEEGARPQGNVLVLDARRAQLALAVEAVIAIVPRESLLGEPPCEAPLTEVLLDTVHGSYRLIALETLLVALERDLETTKETQQKTA